MQVTPCPDMQQFLACSLSITYLSYQSITCSLNSLRLSFWKGSCFVIFLSLLTEILLRFFFLCSQHWSPFYSLFQYLCSWSCSEQESSVLTTFVYFLYSWCSGTWGHPGPGEIAFLRASSIPEKANHFPGVGLPHENQSIQIWIPHHLTYLLFTLQGATFLSRNHLGQALNN